MWGMVAHWWSRVRIPLQSPCRNLGQVLHLQLHAAFLRETLTQYPCSNGAYQCIGVNPREFRVAIPRFIFMMESLGGRGVSMKNYHILRCTGICSANTFGDFLEIDRFARLNTRNAILGPVLYASICWIFRTHDTPSFHTRKNSGELWISGEFLLILCTF